METVLIQLIPIIIKDGIPAAEKIYNMIASKVAPTAADWTEAKRLSDIHSTSVMASRLTMAGIDLESPQGKALLALTGTPAA